ncbi:helix-turn-helix domain-containing protein [Clostridium neuense]|uniref:Helix-turn-helix domain-containing protein n=1 Tax=Clostridium neuense TaxID=1728934 RepID=A0ABW8THT5_9CLOT
MFEWHRTIQKMINIIESELWQDASDEIALTTISQKLGYSKYHVAKQFKALTGITFRNYLRLRRLAYSVIELRDTRERIIDIAIKYSFSSQEAYTRAFKATYGITPNEYRKRKMPLVLKNKQNIFDPYYLGIGESSMNKNELQQISIKEVTLPAHKFLYIKNIEAHDYFGFWKLQEQVPGQDCNTISGLLDSIKGALDSITGKIGEFDGQIGGIFYDETGKSGYAYGIRLPADYKGELPSQMICIDVPKRNYIVFSHGTFDYEKIGASVCRAVDDAFNNYDFEVNGYIQDKSAVVYQIHNPERVGYRLYVPVKEMK